MKRYVTTCVFLISFLFMYQCSSDDDNNVNPPPVTNEFPVTAVGNSGISGTMKLLKNEDQSITYDIQLTGTTNGESYPAHIHYNSAAESGLIAKVLDPVNGTTGTSITTSTELEPGTPVTHEEMMTFDGHILITSMVEGVETTVAYIDIGINRLTNLNRVHNLASVNGSGISGTLTFSQRLSGEALAVIQLSGTDEGTTYTAHIHHGNLSEGGSVFITFRPINGATGHSETHIESSNGPEIVGYNDLVVFDGHADVHASDTDNTVVASSNIGSNQ